MKLRIQKRPFTEITSSASLSPIRSTPSNVNSVALHSLPGNKIKSKNSLVDMLQIQQFNASKIMECQHMLYIY